MVWGGVVLTCGVELFIVFFIAWSVDEQTPTHRQSLRETPARQTWRVDSCGWRVGLAKQLLRESPIKKTIFLGVTTPGEWENHSQDVEAQSKMGPLDVDNV